MCARARELGCARLTLTTHLRRAEAHAFYERLGFEFTGRRYVRMLDAP
jgi:GNAT superfamily N-acetyltransferase